MEITQYFMTKNPCYVARVRFRPKGIIVHSTGANNPYLKRYIGPDDGVLGVNQLGNHWNRPEYDRACVHAFIGKDKNGVVRTYQTLPWDMRGWHAGVRAGNDQFIGFEICEDGLYNIAYLKECFDRAVDLCVHICKEMNIPVNNILGHYEAHQLDLASNHADPRHWFDKWGLGVEVLRKEVQKRLEGDNVDQTPVYLNGIKYDAHLYNGKTFVELRKFAEDLKCKVDYQGSAEKGTIIVPPVEKVCECNTAEFDEVKRALAVLAKHMGV